jgi:hypothetical protein
VSARQQYESGSVVDRDLRTDDEMDSQLLGFLMGAHDAVDPVAIGDGERAKPEAMSLLHQLFGMARALEKRAIGFTEKRDVAHRSLFDSFWCKKGDRGIRG